MGVAVSQKDEFCIYEGRKCVWTTNSPIMCGNTAFDIGDLDEKMLQLVTWTNGVSIGKLCAGLSSYNNPGRDCCRKYGGVCLSGYKRLWCDRARVRTCPGEPQHYQLTGVRKDQMLAVTMLISCVTDRRDGISQLECEEECYS